MSISVSSSATTLTLPSALTVAPFSGVGLPSIIASVVSVNTETLTLPAIPADFPTPNEAEMELTSSPEIASTITSRRAITIASEEIFARVVFVITATSMPAPIPAVERPNPAPPPRPESSVSSIARSKTL